MKPEPNIETEPLLPFDNASGSQQQTQTERADRNRVAIAPETSSFEGVRVIRGEFWTSKQRQASSIHEISYRACFKPQLPRYFIERFTAPGEIVYDPFMGRGTTPIEAALLGRIPWGNDANPLSSTLTKPRLQPPTIDEIATRLGGVDWQAKVDCPEELLTFYHPETLQEICALRHWLLDTGRNTVIEESHATDAWIQMVAVNRLTGHSPGFFSVYTLPPNQAVSIASQSRINSKRKQTPPRRDVPKLIQKKSDRLLRDVTPELRRSLWQTAERSKFSSQPAAATTCLPPTSVALVVTSPPFLNVVQYADDNWLRCWFLGIDPKTVQLTVPRRIEDWRTAMTSVLVEIHRLLKPGGHVAFEVGEVHAGKTKLEEHVLPCGIAAGLRPIQVMINEQQFTKTANCWGIANNSKGTNTNRIVVFQKG